MSFRSLATVGLCLTWRRINVMQKWMGENREGRDHVIRARPFLETFSQCTRILDCSLSSTKLAWTRISWFPWLACADTRRLASVCTVQRAWGSISRGACARTILSRHSGIFTRDAAQTFDICGASVRKSTLAMIADDMEFVASSRRQLTVLLWPKMRYEGVEKGVIGVRNGKPVWNVECFWNDVLFVFTCNRFEDSVISLHLPTNSLQLLWQLYTIIFN